MRRRLHRQKRWLVYRYQPKDVQFQTYEYEKTAVRNVVRLGRLAGVRHGTGEEDQQQDGVDVPQNGGYVHEQHPQGAIVALRGKTHRPNISLGNVAADRGSAR